MKMMLQYGYGMKKHSIELIKSWGEGTVILSPRHLSLEQMVDITSQIKKNNGNVIVDPQFYVPRTHLEDLASHSFWPGVYETRSFFSGQGISSMLDILLNDYAIPLESSGFIIPSLFLEDYNDDWTNINNSILDALGGKSLSIPKYFTLCLGTNVLNDETQIHDLLEEVLDYPVDGFYIIPIHPNNMYLVEDATWQLNLIDLIAGLKLKNKKVILGYSNHQSLLMALAKVDAISAGIWIKTRMFPIGDYKDDDEQDGGRRSIWYYCPQALSEYQIDTLDMAKRVGCLDLLRTNSPYKTEYSSALFQGAQPTTVEFTEPQSYRHYLDCLRMQCLDVQKRTYDDTLKYLKLVFETAFDITNQLRKNGVRGKYRDFNNIAENCLGVIDAFDSMRGLIYRSRWDKI